MFFQLSCDYNMMPLQNPISFGLGRGPYTMSRNCFMGEDLTKHTLEYMHQFFNVYKNDRKYYEVRLISGHEFSGENLQFIDEHLSDSLHRLQAEGHLDNTIVYLYSDHGNHLNFLFWKTRSGVSEIMNPFMFVMVPEWFAEEGGVGEKLEANTQRLCSHFDLFWSDLRLVNATRIDYRVKKGKSLFHEVIGVNRTCKDAMVAEKCNCH